MQSPVERWNEIYSQAESPWKGDPLQAVQENITTLIQGETADLGAGDGRDALFIASQGGKVSAFDISEVGLGRLRKAASEMGIEAFVSTTVADLGRFQAQKMYRNVVSVYTLHFLTAQDGVRLIEEVQAMTEPGGLNIIMADFSSPFPGAEEKDSFYPGPARLSEMYQGWTIISLTEHERKTHQKDEKGDPYRLLAFEMVVRKPS